MRRLLLLEHFAAAVTQHPVEDSLLAQRDAVSVCARVCGREKLEMVHVCIV